MTADNNLYPLLFIPMYRQLCWGGTKFADILHRNLPDNEGNYAESWDVCDREDAESVVWNGALAGVSLHELMKRNRRALVGERYTGDRFPVMVKLLDVSSNNSMQVHPDVRAARKIGNGSAAKTEMWYILQADRNAKIWAGLAPSVTRPRFIDSLNTPAVVDCVKSYPSVVGDAYFINAGRVHAIGAGNLLLEVQENSETTYRIYDWDRVDANGKPRELHIPEALECIDFMDRYPARVPAASNTSKINRKYALVNKCPTFSVDELRLVKDWPDSTCFSNSAHLISAINTPVKLHYQDGEIEIPQSFTALLPACLGEYIIRPAQTPATVIRTVIS